MFQRSAFFIICMALAIPSPAYSFTITVKQGDTLSRIAAEHLGNAERWPELCEINQSLLGNDCDLLIVGAPLSLPEAANPSGPVETVPTEITEAPTAPARVPPNASIELGMLPAEFVSIDRQPVSYAGLPVLAVTLDPRAGPRRIRYFFVPDESADYSVSWPMRDIDLSSAIVLAYSGTSVVGRLNFSRTEDVYVTTVSGAIKQATVGTGDNGWMIVDLTLGAEADSEPVQLLFYPTGYATEPLEQERTFSMTVPTVTR